MTGGSSDLWHASSLVTVVSVVSTPGMTSKTPGGEGWVRVWIDSSLSLTRARFIMN